jgi:cytochrome c biogenesis protein CcdA
VNTSLLATLAALALADSLNPFTVAAQAYLLGTPRPMARSAAFLIATFVTYLVGGVLLLEGLSLFVARIVPLIPAWGLGAGELVLGLLLALAAIHTARMARAGTPFTPPAQLGLGATILFAVGSTASDVPTAIPYFAAVGSIAAQNGGWGHDLLLLTLYNLLYCAPLIALLTARAVLSEKRSETLFGRLRMGIDWAFARLLPPLVALGAVALVIDGARRIASL